MFDLDHPWTAALATSIVGSSFGNLLLAGWAPGLADQLGVVSFLLAGAAAVASAGWAATTWWGLRP